MVRRQGQDVTQFRCLSTWLSVLGACCLILAISGCSDTGMVNDRLTGTSAVTSFFEAAFDKDAVSKRTDIAELEIDFNSQRLQTFLGGMIPLQQDASVEAFVVLPGSFPSDTTFTIETTRFVTSDGDPIVLYDFGPDGLQFSRPAVVRINVVESFGKKTTSLDFYWLNPGTGYWELQNTYKVDDQGYIYADVSHFSIYGVGSVGGDTAK